MTRPHIVVRPAVRADAHGLVRLWQEVLAAAGPIGRTSEAPTVAAVEARLESLEDDDSRVLLVAADDDDQPVALAHVVTETLTPLHETSAARISYFHVSERHRRRGIGTALLTGAAAWADSSGVEHLLADVSPTARETNRFFARLGFGQLVVQRVVPLAKLRRLLAGPAGGVGSAEGGAVRRASLRARARGATRLRRSALGMARTG